MDDTKTPAQLTLEVQDAGPTLGEKQLILCIIAASTYETDTEYLHWYTYQYQNMLNQLTNWNRTAVRSKTCADSLYASHENVIMKRWKAADSVCLKRMAHAT